MTTKQLPDSGNRVTFEAFLSTAHDLADLSGQAILPHFRRPSQIDNKASDGSFDPVTIADRGAEQAIRQAIQERWPDHGIVGEEFGVVQPDAAYTWIIDPIDGTRSFILGMPVWGTLIGLTAQSAPLLGLMDQPFTKERFWSTAECSLMRVGAGEPVALETRQVERLEQATLSTTHPDLFDKGEDAQRFFELKDHVKLCRYGGDCYAYALLAAGYIDLIVEAGLKSYDIVALIPIIERAGGIVTTWSGEPATHGGRIIAAGNRRLHEQAIKILQG